MIKVEFLGPIGKDAMEVEAGTLSELSILLRRDKKLAAWLPKCAVALNDTMVSNLDTPLHPGDKVTILPPVCGG